jgi:Dockerin type I domain/Bacterial pre-peptidase C-terminal domain
LVMQGIVSSVEDPNDSISEAIALGNVSTVALSSNETISPDTDVDMFSFTVSAGQIVDFNINTPLNGPGSLGTYIRLFNASGTQLAANNDAAAPGETQGSDSYLRFTFPSAGTFYLGVSNSNNIGYNPNDGTGDTSGGSHSTGGYQLLVQALPADPDNTFGKAVSLGPVSITATSVSAAIDPDIDIDIYSFSVSAGQVVDLNINTALNGPGGLGSYIRLFSSTGAQLAFNNDAAGPGEVLGADAYLRYTFVSAGTYYLGVTNATNIGYDPLTGSGTTAGGLNSIGSYQLIVQAIAPTVSDSNDTFSEAVALGSISSSAKSINETISPDVDVDMYSFTVSAGQTVDLNINTPLNGPGGLGSYIRLFNATGSELAFNNDAAAPNEMLGMDSYLRFTFATAGTYYLGVSNSNNIAYNPITGEGDASGGANSVGSYQLIVQAVVEAFVDTNDELSEASPLGAITATAVRSTDAISPETDVDMFSFSVVAGQVVDFNINTPFNGPGGLGSYIRLFDSTGMQLAFNDNAAAPGEALGYDSYLRFVFANAGTYFVGVSNDKNSTYDPLTGDGDTIGSLNPTGSYTLAIQAISIGAATLTMSISPSSVSELNGVAVGTVRRNNGDMSSALTVFLDSSSPADATVPDSVLIPANQDSFEFQILAVHNLLHGTTQVSITATAANYVSADQAIVILESDKLWHNFVQPTDVNNDQSVTALDALIIIDHLNRNRPGSVPTTGTPPPYLDVNGDNQVTPIDILLVISKLNLRGNGSGEGESNMPGQTRTSTASAPAIADTAADQVFADFDTDLSQEKEFWRRSNRSRRFA